MSTEKDIVIYDDSKEQPKEKVDPEAAQAEAYNPETGEINWDCPCLGPMVQPPCGEKFKEAFSCFVYSTEEPKGADCVAQFREMQKCFQEHPDIYGAELDDDDDDEEEKEAPKEESKH
ncbi:Oxidoreductase [Boothiomyces macroporosus]|uniref:Mitochondrial intermembrane space import and assembly protein 40 n=1 Tax=Boothiomyces macroporosus TaxID=261099 RepID=A0AAD5UM34_9FUNG|nr:Oxidoreductase [Boothiomyces macroporosus]